MKFKITLIVLLLLVINIGCKNESSKNNNKIKIASILPLTGPAAEYGNYIKKGQLKAIEELNKNQDSLVFELIFRDGKADISKSLTEYELLKSEGIKYYTTTISSVCVVLSKKAREDKVIMFADASHPDITNPPSLYVFRHFGTIKQESDLIIQAIDDTSTAFLFANNEFGNGFKKYFNENIENISFQESFSASSTSNNSLVQKIKRSDYKNVVLIGYGGSGISIINELRRQKINSKIYTPLAFVITNSHKKISVDLTEIYTNNLQILNTAETDIGTYEAFEYGTIKLLGESIFKAKDKNNTQEVSKTILNTKTFITDYEKMTINSDGNIIPTLKTIELTKIK